MRIRELAIMAIGLSALLAWNAAAAEGPAAGRIAGVVEDSSGAVVAGGTVTIKNLASGLAQSKLTDQQGRYVFEAAPIGRYKVTASYSGFETAVRNDVTVAENLESSVTLVLRVGNRWAPRHTFLKFATSFKPAATAC
jgi:hypothetical protein